jgi:hypothetical protein
MAYSTKNVKAAYEFGIRFKIFTQDGFLFEHFNGLSVLNTSTNADLYFENIKLVPGQQFQIDGNLFEYNYQQFTLKFVSTGAGSINQAIVTIKNYV